MYVHCSFVIQGPDVYVSSDNKPNEWLNNVHYISWYY